MLGLASPRALAEPVYAAVAEAKAHRLRVNVVDIDDWIAPNTPPPAAIST